MTLAWLILKESCYDWGYLQKERKMKLKIAFTALVLGLSPAVASAMCSSMKPAQTASICSDGKVWDSGSAMCIEPVSS